MIAELLSSASAFEFFQAVRLLEAEGARVSGAQGVGGDVAPEHEWVRFRTRPSLAFAGTDVVDARAVGGTSGRVELDVAFLGFIGTAGVLPQRYTELAIERLLLRDRTLRDWLDLFQHRVLSLFYRAWCKYRFPFAFERERREHRREDPFTRAMFSLVGLGAPPFRGRVAFPDVQAVFSGGHLARTVRTAAGLGRVLADLLGVPVRVEEFGGRWLPIPPEELCVLPRRDEAPDHRVALGGGATLGRRVFDVQSRVTIGIGPLTLRQYERLCAHGPAYRPWVALASFYLRLEHDFQVRYELAPGQSPGSRLAARGAEPTARLGSNTWLESASAAGDLRHSGSRVATASCGHSGRPSG